MSIIETLSIRLGSMRKSMEMGIDKIHFRVVLSLALVVVVITISGCVSGGQLSSPQTASPAPTPTPTPTGSHTVTLTWDASSSPNLQGYRVYRSQTSGGPYANISGAPVASLQFIDSFVANGQDYFYVVTSVDSNGLESAPSPQVSAQIPTS
jgi:fibronectin type 3 domain-containing protein